MCGASSSLQRANIVLCADKLISFCAGGVPVSSNPNGSKIFDLPCGFYVAIADDISRSHQVVSYLHDRMKDITRDSPRIVDQVKLALEQTAEWVRLWMRREVLAHHGISLQEFLHDNDLTLRDAIAEEIEHRVIETELIVAGFGQNECPILFRTDCVNIHEQPTPGFFCGGAGAMAALDWLNFRQQNCFMSVQRTFYHVREAWEYSTISPVVGDMVNLILLRPGKPMKDISPLTPVVQEWYSKMFPRKTDELDQNAAWDKFVSAYGIND
jgi:hypothetical protein